MDMNLKRALEALVIPLLLASLLVGVHVVKADDAVSIGFSLAESPYTHRLT